MFSCNLCSIIPQALTSLDALIALRTIECLWVRLKLGLIALCAIKLGQNTTLGDLTLIQLYRVQQNTFCRLVPGYSVAHFAIKPHF